MAKENPIFTLVINDCRKRILPFYNPSLSLVQDIIENSIYWDHPTGGRVRAPKDSERVVEGKRGWEIVLGGNTFLIGLAIQRCANTLSHEIDIFDEDLIEHSYNQLAELLKKDISGSVANYHDNQYRGYYPLHDDFMEFGNHLVNVKYIVDYFLYKSDIKALYKFIRIGSDDDEE